MIFSEKDRLIGGQQLLFDAEIGDAHRHHGGAGHPRFFRIETLVPGLDQSMPLAVQPERESEVLFIFGDTVQGQGDALHVLLVGHARFYRAGTISKSGDRCIHGPTGGLGE